MTSHPLTRPAAWRLRLGAASVPLIKWAGGALWACAALLALSWLAGLVQDAFAGQLPAWVGAAATLAVIAWFVMAWQVIKQWFIQSDSVTLSWQGPVQAADPTRRGHDVAQGGFHVVEWHSAVQVRVVLDWQHWMLLRIRPLDTRHDRPEIFCWMGMPQTPDEMNESGSTLLHQLRSLLYLPPAWIAQAGDQPASSAGQAPLLTMAVASCAAPVKSGLPLSRTLLHSSLAQRSSSDFCEADTLFPPTELLDDAWLHGSDDLASKGAA
jgi:hypothetical protein